MANDPKASSRSRSADASALVGSVVAGKYRLLRAVGHGGMGTVFKAENTAIGKIVALKLLHANLADDEVILQRMQREARATVSIAHPNIVEVLDMGQEHSGASFIVMEYVRGKSLKKVLRDMGQLETQRACRIAGQVLEALVATHERGVVHRDLKPDNILLTPRYGEPDFVKVFDFGISTFIESMNARERLADLTPTGFTMATPFYASPEQVRGEKGRDPRVDLYAVGVVLYEMLAGARPFGGESLHELCKNILAGKAAPFRVFRTDVTAGLEAAVARALAPRQAERYQTAQEMLWALVPFGASPPRNEEPEPTDTFTLDLRELRDREGLALSAASQARPPSSATASVPQVVRAELVRGLIDHFEQRFGDECRRVLARLPQETQRELEQRGRRDGWCRASALGRALDALDTALGDGERAQVAEAGRHFARAHYYAEERLELFKNITPELFFSMSSDIYRRYFASGEARVVKVGRGYGRLEVGTAPHSYLANAVAWLGVLDEGLRLSGASEISVRLVQSVAVGDERDQFEATWAG